ncbi:MAG: hypothetical protein AAGJ88_04330 [Pseudomonadota bacterium]
MSYLIYAVSWLLAVFIHINTLKRTSLTNTKEAIVNEIYSLLDAGKSDDELLVKETTFAHKFTRIENKVKEFNTLCKRSLISTEHDDFQTLFVYDVEDGDHSDLTRRCYDAVDYVDKTFHRQIQNKYSFFYLNRYELAGTFASLFCLYALIKIVSWIFGSDI